MVMRVQCSCGAHRVVQGACLSVHREGVELERHATGACWARGAVDEEPKALAKQQPTASMRHTVRGG